MAVWVQEGLEELLHIQGQEGRQHMRQAGSCASRQVALGQSLLYDFQILWVDESGYRGKRAGLRI